MQGFERSGEGEVFVEEQAGGEQAGAGIAAGEVEQVGVGRVEDEGRDCRVGGGEWAAREAPAPVP